MMATLEQWLASHQALTIKVFLIIFAGFLLNLLIQRFLNGVKKQFDKTENPWDDILADSLSRPIAYLVGLAGLLLAVSLVNQDQEHAALEKILSLKHIYVLMLVGWFLIRFVKRAEVVFADRYDDPHDLTTVIAIAKLARFSIIITVLLMAMQALGYSIEGVLAFGGVGGIAIGFAAKDLLANFFGGLMVYLDRPFVVGDWIRSPDRDIEGVVENIGWRLTLIRTFDKRPLYVPNSIFANIAIENPSRMTNRRIYETVGLRYDDASAVEPIIAEVKAMLIAHPEIDNDQTMIVNFDAFAASSLDFFIYTFTKTTDWIRFHEIKQDVLVKVLDIVAAHGAEVAFPTSTVHIQGEQAEKRLAPEPA